MDRETGKKFRFFCVAFGGNVETNFGSPLETMEMALKRLSTAEIRITSVSRFFDTLAFPEGSGPNFVNGVVSLESSLDPDALLAVLHSLEAEFGRLRTTRWGARTLDLDILFCDDEIVPNERIWQKWHDLAVEKQVKVAPDQLILPHPRLQDRAFVLVPLADVASDWVHPVLQKSVHEMLSDLPNNLKNEVKPL